MFLCLCRMNNWPVAELPEKGLATISLLAHTRLHKPLTALCLHLFYVNHVESCMFGMCCVCIVSRPPAGDLGWGRHCIGEKGKKYVKWRKEAARFVFPVASDSQFFARKQLSNGFFLSNNKHHFLLVIKRKVWHSSRPFHSLKILTDPKPKYGAHYFPRKAHQGENTLTLFFYAYN